MCEFINNYQLFSNLQYRFEYLTKFIGFTSEDVQTIHTHAAPVLSPLLPNVVDLIFNHIERLSLSKYNEESPRLKSSIEIAIQEQKSIDLKEHIYLMRELCGFQKDEIQLSSVDENHDSMEVLSLLKRETLTKYLEKLVTAQINDEKFIRYLDWIGKLHTKQFYDENGKPMNKMYVDYIHLNNFFGYLSDIIIQAIFDSKLKRADRDCTIKALNKLMWLHNDFFTKYQVDDSNRHLESTIVCPVSGASGKSCPSHF